MTVFFNILLLIFSIFMIIRSIAYGIYEINENNNKVGRNIFYCILYF